jgi:small subunit ribosomal protein S4
MEGVELKILEKYSNFFLNSMRYTGPKNRLSRREGVDLELKSKPVDFSRLIGGKFVKKNNKVFNLQLRSKQLAKRLYGLSEKQFRNLYNKADKSRFPTGYTFLSSLERRFDNLVYRSGFSLTRAQARQMVNHGVFFVNGVKMDIPSYQVRVNDSISVREKFVNHPVFEEVKLLKKNTPSWISVDLKKRSIEVNKLPEEGDFETLVNVQSIIEFYSR